MIHLCGWAESQDTAGVLTTVTALGDPAMSVSGDNIQVPNYAPFLIGFWAMGATITRAQLQSPSLRRIVNPEIEPLNVAAAVANNYSRYVYPDAPVQLDINEQLQALIAEGAAGAEQGYVLAWLSDGKIDPYQGEIHTVRVTAAKTLVANQWTNGALVFDQVLPVGRYAIVGAAFISADLIAFRFLFQASTPRPGSIGKSSVNYVEMLGQRYGGWGSWGEFDSTNPPTVDFLASAADTSEVGYIDLVKVG